MTGPKGDKKCEDRKRRYTRMLFVTNSVLTYTAYLTLPTKFLKGLEILK
jgi:hypothetical protein